MRAAAGVGVVADEEIALVDVRHVIENLEQVRDALSRRSEGDAALLAPVAELGEKRRALIVFAFVVTAFGCLCPS